MPTIHFDSRLVVAIERRIDNAVLALGLTLEQHAALLRGILPELYHDGPPIHADGPGQGERDGALPLTAGGSGSQHFGQAVKERHNGLEVDGQLLERPGRRFNRPADAAEPQASKRGRGAAAGL